MIPLKDYNRTRTVPWMTIALIALNVAVFIRDRLTGHYETVLLHTGGKIISVNQFIGGLSERLALVPSHLVAHPGFE